MPGLLVPFYCTVAGLSIRLIQRLFDQRQMSFGDGFPSPLKADLRPLLDLIEPPRSQLATLKLENKETH